MKTPFPLLLALLLAGCAGDRPAYLDTRLTFEERVDDLVGRMTPRQKVDQLRYDAPAIDSLHVPAHNWWNEALHGVARDGLATVFPQPVGLAATWDADLVSAVATAISDEARAKHHDHARRGQRGIYQGLSAWAPNINIFRDPRWGRGMETYGEDPYLAGELAVRFIRGLQGDHPRYLKVIAGVKHFAVHSGPESTRHAFDVRPSTRDLLDTYLPHFERAVREGGAYCVMCAYQRLDGLPCCANPALAAILRDEWDFPGYIVSDCWAIHDFFQPGRHGFAPDKATAAAMALRAGTDQNCGDSYPALIEALDRGLITGAEIDRSVKRVMLARARLGQFDPDDMNPYTAIPLSVLHSGKHRDLALDAARASIVLLENDRGILPLDKNTRRVAVIGPNAHDRDLLLGNYHGFPARHVTPLEGIRDKLPGARVTHAPGSPVAAGVPLLQPVPGDVLFTDSTLATRGLLLETFDNSAFSGERTTGKLDTGSIDVARDTGLPPGTDHASRWSGVLVPPVTGHYIIGGEAYPRFELYLDDEKIAAARVGHEMTPAYRALHLEAGRPYRLRFDHAGENETYSLARLLWEPPGDLHADAIAVARDADAVILCLGLSPRVEGEEMRVHAEGFAGGDRTDIRLPRVQEELLRDVLALGKPTVLVLLNGSAIAIDPATNNRPAIIEAWYPGQEGGTAIADVIFGDYNPAGRLPVTFYRSVDDLPPFDDYNMDGRTYRYFTGTPLYPFGHGLSYTRFEYANLHAPDTLPPGHPVTLAVDGPNAGTRDGEEVVQLYLTFLDPAGSVPARSLEGFRRVKLAAGQTRRVEFTIQPSRLASVQGDTRLPENGPLLLSVGGGQPDQPRLDARGALQTTITIHQ
jgi:beta-glucosidase